MTTFVDASYADDVVTRWSMTGILMFFQSSPIIYYSKMQKTVESCAYGFEGIAARIATEMIIAQRYRLCMMPIKLIASAMLVGDNLSVQIGSSTPSS